MSIGHVIKNHCDETLFYIFVLIMLGLLMIMARFICSGGVSLKRKCHHFDESFITGCTESCHFDNFRCSQWWRFHQNEDIFVSVFMHIFSAQATGGLSENISVPIFLPKNLKILNQRSLLLAHLINVPLLGDHFFLKEGPFSRRS